MLPKYIQQLLALNKYQVWRNTWFREKTPGSPRFSFNKEGGSRCQRQYYIPWAGKAPLWNDPFALWTAAKDFLGYPTYATNANGVPYLSRTIPHTFQNFSNFFFAEQIQDEDGVIPAGKDIFGTGQFSEAILSMVYSTPLYNILTDSVLGAANTPTGLIDEASLLRYVTADWQTAGKYQTIPSFQVMRFMPGDPAAVVNPAGGFGAAAAIGGAALGGFGLLGNAQGSITSRNSVGNTEAVFLSEGDLTIDWHEVPAKWVPWKAIQATEGKTNDKPFGHPQSLIGQRPAGTLVMMAPKRKLIRLITGDLGYTISFRFKNYPNGANSFFNPYRSVNNSPSPGFQKAARFGTNVGNASGYLIGFADFDQLFRPSLTG